MNNRELRKFCKNKNWKCINIFPWIYTTQNEVHIYTINFYSRTPFIYRNNFNIIYLVTFKNAEILRIIRFLSFFFSKELIFEKYRNHENQAGKIEKMERRWKTVALKPIRNRFSQRFIAGQTGERKFIASRPVFRLNWNLPVETCHFNLHLKVFQLPCSSPWRGEKERRTKRAPGNTGA